jgi:DNA-binding NarL/FixJ family response regulator
MSSPLKSILVSHDAGLLAHWRTALSGSQTLVMDNFRSLEKLRASQDCLVWIDMALPELPNWGDLRWARLFSDQKVRLIVTSSAPADNDAIHALDAGCAGFCHAFSDADTLRQVRQVVEAGHIWIGKTLMRRLIHSAESAAQIKPQVDLQWAENLTLREKEIALLAANGASNQKIAQDCQISERTVKAHLGATFEKLNVTDRLQLALRVHGIH